MGGTNHRFIVDIPPGWSDQTIHTIVGPTDRGVQHTLTIAIDNDPETRDLEDYSRRRIEAMKSANPDLEVLKEEQIILPSGRPAFEFTTKSVSTSTPPIISKRIFLVDGHTVFTCSADFAKHTLHTLGTLVTAMIDSLTTKFDS